MILFLSNADTELLAVRSLLHRLPDGFPPVRAANPAGLVQVPGLAGVAAVVVRLLGGRRSWEGPFDELVRRCREQRVALIAVGGEAVPDAELASRSTVPAGIAAEVHRYLAAGGPANLEHCLRFVADTVLVGGFGFEAPAPVPMYGVFEPATTPRRGGRPLVGIVFYRAHLVAGNTTFVEELAAAVDAAGADALSVFCYSLRPDGPTGEVPALEVCRQHGVDVLITTVLAMGSSAPAGAEAWEVPQLAGLGVPVIQAPACNRSRDEWLADEAGLSPLDVAMGVAIPEFDGRIIGPAFAFKEEVDDGGELGVPISATRADPERAARVARLALRHAALRHRANAEKRVAVVLSAPDYGAFFAGLPDDARHQVEAVWGPPPGHVYLHDGALCLPGLDLGGVLVTIQPPRGFGSDPIGTYHAPDVPPPHHYLAFYRWLAAAPGDGGWGADAVVHVGKHGTLEWLPGKANGLSSACFPDAAIGDLPLVYPFVVNDPGEGTQAKRRAHAVVVDHLVPPMTRAETYDELARLEQLLDAYAQAQAMDPAKLPALRRQVWDLLVEAEIHRDLGLAGGPEAFDADAFNDLVVHVDGYLCALKDAQIRGGLHTLGEPPGGGALVDLVLGITRLAQGDVPSLRATVAGELGVDLSAHDRSQTDAVEAACRARVESLAAAGWDPAGAGADPTLAWVAGRLVPALRRTPDEITNVLAALDGRYVPAGPSGAPTRGAAHVLPTGRNFYSVDPKALPSPLSWEVGRHLAAALVERHISETGAPPRTVGLVLWGTAAMRTGGDDTAQALALMGVRPTWEPESRRVTGLEVIPLAELGRPRVDVTLRISGFFRDAFPHLVALLDDAAGLVAALDEPEADNPLRAAGTGDARIFGPPPGGYGSGILPVLERGSWRTDADLAEVYLAWSGFAYRRGAMGDPAPEAMRRRFAAIEVAVKNQDNREHDIFDSDDYLQDHGGMVAAVRALTGRAPRAWFGDTADPAAPAVRSLAEEAARVVRSRVLNPRWTEAMRRHGYKGAFELAATVDYLFGYDATTGVVEDWMYERVTDAYVADPDMRKFFAASNPWALRAIAERLLEAARRGLWAEPGDAARRALEDAVLEAEGWEEARS